MPRDYLSVTTRQSTIAERHGFAGPGLTNIASARVYVLTQVNRQTELGITGLERKEGEFLSRIAASNLAAVLLLHSPLLKSTRNIAVLIEYLDSEIVGRKPASSSEGRTPLNYSGEFTSVSYILRRNR